MASLLSSEEVFDFAVIGRGLVGSAAAKYLGKSTVLIGPKEADHDSRGVFSCHGDEGRICRRLDPDPVWATLAARSMDRYDEISSKSGVSFHRPRGCLALGRSGGPFLTAVAATAFTRNLTLEKLSQKQMADRWPALVLDATLLRDAEDTEGWDTEPPAYEGLYESPTTGAGDISPRGLLEAQLRLFTGRCVERVAVAVVEDAGALRVDLDDGTSVRARKVLVATNALTNFRPLLPRKLALTLTTQSTRRRVFAAGEFEMPSVIVKGGASKFGVAKQFDAVYAVSASHAEDDARCGQPTLSLKLGHGAYFERELKTEEEVLAWYRNAGEDRRDSLARCELKAALDRLIRKPRPECLGDDVTGRCVIPKTATSRPYLHSFGRVACCVGCNGYAAKSSDELGRLGAEMLVSGDHSNWGDEIPKDAFTTVFAD